jgi:protoporphyrinogen/coproporphyrinogen III oxidase
VEASSGGCGCGGGRRPSGRRRKTSEWSLFVSLREGLSGLVEAIRTRLDGVTLLPGRRVTGIALKEGRQEVSIPGGPQAADAVVITTNTGTAAGWIEGWDPSLAKQLREIQYVSTATVSLGFKKQEVTHPLRGFGFVVPRREGRKIMASTWSSTKFPGRAPAGHLLIRTFLGGAHQEHWVEQEDATLISIARQELQSILGIRAEPVVAKVFRWIKANPQYHVGHLDRIAEIEKRASTHPGLFLAGAAYRGVGIPDCIRQGMETAEKIVRLFSNRSSP